MTAQQLKNSILQLAVQGKLVPQDPNDEPASVLLERIRKEKEKLIKEGKIKREKNPSVIFRGADNTPYEKVGNAEPVSIADEAPFDIPDSWEWARLKNFCLDIFSGKSPKYEKVKTDFQIIGQAANQQSGLDYSQIKYTNKEFWDSMDDRYFLRNNDVILNTLGNGTLGRSGIIENLERSLLTDGHLFVFRTFFPVSSWYLYLYLQHRKEEIEKVANGSTNQTFLSLNNTIEWMIPVPPLSEQKRIVAKYRSVLSCLESYGDAYLRVEELNVSFPDMLKKSILQMAVQGKLVPQDSNEEPASVLLERIRAEKEKLIVAGKIKRDKNESVIFRRDNSHYENHGDTETCIDDELVFDIPKSWELIRLNDIGIYQKGPFGSSLTKSMFVPKGQDSIKVYEQKNAIRKDYALGDYYITRKYYTEKMSGFSVKPGDIIVSCAGTIGETYVLPDGIEEGIINQALMKMTIFAPIDIDYFLLYFDYVLKQSAREGSKGSAIKNIPPFEIFKKLLLPLPPLQEQKRIVEQVATLEGLCNLL